MTHVLIVEDGHEYIDTLGRFLAEDARWSRAGSGPEALAFMADTSVDVVLLDMRFDRTPADQLLGDLDQLAERFNGDRVQARGHLEDHQGMFILSALREAGVNVPVIVSYDFGLEPGRFARLETRFAPVAYLADNASVGELRAALAWAKGV